MNYLADRILRCPGPIAWQILGDPDVPRPHAFDTNALPSEGMATIGVLIGDGVSEYFFGKSPIEDWDTRRDIHDLTPHYRHRFVEMARPSRIFSAEQGISSSAHLPDRWGWRIDVADREDLAA